VHSERVPAPRRHQRQQPCARPDVQHWSAASARSDGVLNGERVCAVASGVVQHVQVQRGGAQQLRNGLILGAVCTGLERVESSPAGLSAARLLGQVPASAPRPTATHSSSPVSAFTACTKLTSSSPIWPVCRQVALSRLGAVAALGNGQCKACVWHQHQQSFQWQCSALLSSKSAALQLSGNHRVHLLTRQAFSPSSPDESCHAGAMCNHAYLTPRSTPP